MSAAVDPRLDFTEPTAEEHDLAPEAWVEWQAGDAWTRFDIALELAYSCTHDPAHTDRWLVRARHYFEQVRGEHAAQAAE